MENFSYIIAGLVFVVCAVFFCIAIYYLIKSYKSDIKVSESKNKYYELKIKRLRERMK